MIFLLENCVARVASGIGTKNMHKVEGKRSGETDLKLGATRKQQQ